MLKKKEKTLKLERTAMPAVLKALERFNTTLCYAVYRTESISPQYTRNCGLVLLCGCSFGCLVRGGLKTHCNVPEEANYNNGLGSGKCFTIYLTQPLFIILLVSTHFYRVKISN